MKLSISYNSAVSRYPSQVEEILRQKNESGCKHKNTAPENMRWEFNWAIEIGNGKRQIFGMSLCGRVKYGKWYASITDTPQEIVEMHERERAAEEAEQKRIDALTPEQRNKETQEILSRLMGTPGFVHVQVRN
jgi:hypothetical protein